MTENTPIPHFTNMPLIDFHISIKKLISFFSMHNECQNFSPELPLKNES
jgi:hypothetical protein